MMGTATAPLSFLRAGGPSIPEFLQSRPYHVPAVTERLALLLIILDHLDSLVVLLPTTLKVFDHRTRTSSMDRCESGVVGGCTVPAEWEDDWWWDGYRVKDRQDKSISQRSLTEIPYGDAAY
jgi:hypothetical protein